MGESGIIGSGLNRRGFYCGCVFGKASYIPLNIRPFRITDIKNCQGKLKRNPPNAKVGRFAGFRTCMFCLGCHGRLSMMKKLRWGVLGPRGEYPYLYAKQPDFFYFIDTCMKKGANPSVAPKTYPVGIPKHTPYVPPLLDEQNIPPT